MLPTSRRVKKVEFPGIFKKGLSFRGESLVFCLKDRKDKAPSRFSFVISSKIAKTAVKRHHIKRRLSSIVEANLANIRPGLSGVFLCQKDISAVPRPKVFSEVIFLLQKSRTLN